MPARRAAAAPRPAAPGSDRCARCDGTFGCGVDSGSCWCADETLTSEHSEQLAARFDGCLCPECLRQLAQSPPGAATV